MWRNTAELGEIGDLLERAWPVTNTEFGNAFGSILYTIQDDTGVFPMRIGPSSVRFIHYGNSQKLAVEHEPSGNDDEVEAMVTAIVRKFFFSTLDVMEESLK